MQPKYVKLVQMVALLLVLSLLLYLFWPRNYQMVFDERAYLPIRRTKSIGEIRLFGMTSSAHDSLRCWLGRHLLNGSLSPIKKMHKPKVVKIENPNKGWAMELSNTLPVFNFDDELLLGRTTEEGLSLHALSEPLEMHKGRWSAEDLETSHPPVAMFWRTKDTLLAVYPYRVLLLLPKGQVKKVDRNEKVFNWSAAWREEKLLLGRAGEMLLFDFNRKKKRKIKLPTDKVAPWAQVRAITFVETDRAVIAISDPQPERCCLYKVDLAAKENKWGKGIKLPVTKDDFGFVCLPALRATKEGDLRIFCVQYTAGGGSAILFHMDGKRKGL